MQIREDSATSFFGHQNPHDDVADGEWPSSTAVDGV